MDVPKPGDDKPQLGRVAIITVVGFAVGLLWPRLAGVKLVPNAPTEGTEVSAGAEPAASASSESPPPAAKAVPAEAPEGEPAPPSSDAAERLKVSDPKVTSCRDAKGARVSTCDSPELGESVRAKVLALAACGGAENVQGTLSLGVELDFATGKASDVLKGKSTTIADSAADALLACAKKEFSTLSLKGVAHEQAQYTVFYMVEFVPPGTKRDDAKGEASSITPASGRATVGWEVAIIREHPKDGEIIARVMRGTRVTVTGRDGDWYRIKYDAKGSEGWVFRTAIGM